MVLAAVKAGDLFEVIWVSMVAGVAVTTLFSFVVLFGGRSAESRRQGAGTQALAYLALAALCFLSFAAVVVFGVQIMLSK
jgi:hypothetical protein